MQKASKLYYGISMVSAVIWFVSIVDGNVINSALVAAVYFSLASEIADLKFKLNKYI